MSKAGHWGLCRESPGHGKEGRGEGDQHRWRGWRLTLRHTLRPGDGRRWRAAGCWLSLECSSQLIGRLARLLDSGVSQTTHYTLVNRVRLPRRRRQTLAKLRVRRGLNQLRETGISSHAHPDTAGSPSPAKLAKRKTTSWVQAVQAATFPHAKISGACLQTRAGLVRVRGKL